MKTSACLLLLASLTVSTSTRLGAQAESEITHAPDGGISRHVEGIFVPAIPGAPFTTKEQVQLTNHLADGTVVAQKYYAMIVRDGQGRVYRETRGRIPMGSDREPPITRFYVNDPRKGVRTTCYLASHTCEVTRWRPETHFTEEQVGQSKDGLSYLTREEMGRATIDSLDVIDTRETRTFNAGAFGNDRAMAVTKRYWYSPQLQINLAVNRQDPRTEDQKLELTELSLSEPDPAWFAIPEGFRLVSPKISAPAAVENGVVR